MNLHRSSTDRVFAGVCGGIAETFNLDSSTVRLITVLLILFGGMSLWIYIVAALLLPLE
ncbi:PspC domain protein [Peptoniphilus duerdenii ATCC BAA-1640]|uniref:PspC domain protein n=1 Tax=Peptoniphilus duerdenii ATCC BAA-1640 TaxID=862517 RepID=E0NNV6_9FIRM|nr:PspC domain-containing protein [Peptoniphilus duerdenii]EFM24424.1 PspC domain protein [Peptoniphilus duerdenii ATCC BAA-1640]